MKEPKQVELIISIPQNMWISSNSRMHWAEKQKRTKQLRTKGWATAKQLPKRFHMRKAQCTAHIQYRTNVRADPANAYPTVKALIDGIIDTGLLPDDDHEHLIGPDMRRDEGQAPRGTHRIRLTFKETK